MTHFAMHLTIPRTRLSILVVFFTLALFAATAEAATPTTQEIEEALTCQCSCGLTVHSCNHLQCSFAVPAKQTIADQLSQGVSRDVIIQGFVSRYGEKVLSSPTTEGFNLAAWIMPFLVVLVGGVMVGVVSLRWSRRRPQQQDDSSTPATSGTGNDPYRNRLQKELDEFDV